MTMIDLRAWLVRALLAAMLLFGADVLLWAAPLAVLPGEWALRLLAALALSAALLDLAARFRARGLIGMVLLAGLYGLAASLLLYPALAFADVPRTLITRVTGAQTLAALLMLALFFGQGRRPYALWVGNAVAGLFWGLWGRWSPLAADLGVTETPLVTLLLAGLVGVLVIGLLWALSARAAVHDIRLNRVEQRLTALLLSALLLLRVAQNVIDGFSLVIISVLAALCWALLWYDRRRRAPALVDAALPRLPLTLSLVIGAVVFLGLGVVGYGLPRAYGDADLIEMIGAGLLTFGLVWLPTVSLALGMRAFLRLIRAQPL